MDISILESQIEEIKKKYTNEYGKLNNDGYKGALIELYTLEILNELGYEVHYFRDKNDNITKGDLKIIDCNSEEWKGECKSSHVWNCTDKLGIDIKYTEIFMRDNEGNYIKSGNRKRRLHKEDLGKIPYNQNNSTGTDIGWLYTSNSDWIIAINLDNMKCYIIYEAQKLLEQLRYITDLYSITVGYEQWYKNSHENYINDYVEGSIKTDSCKESYIINLELSPESFEYFNVKYDIIDFKVRVVKRKIEYKKRSNTTANSKRSSR